MSQSAFNEYNQKVITTLQARIRTLEEELRIARLELDFYKQELKKLKENGRHND